MNEVTFSDYVKILYSVSDARNHYQFIQDLFKLVMEPLDCSDADGNTEEDYYPFSRLERVEADMKITDNFFKKKPRDVSQAIAKKIVLHWNSQEFEDKIYGLSPESREQIINEFQIRYGFNWQDEQLEENLANLLQYILRKIAKLTTNSQDEYMNEHSNVPTTKMVPCAPVHFRGDKLLFNGCEILFDREQLKQKVAQQEPLEYKKCLLDAYSSTGSKKYKSEEKLPREFKNDFVEQRNFFLLAEGSRRWVQDSFTNNGAEQFAKLEDDLYGGIRSVYKLEWDNGYERLLKVQDKATSIQLTNSDVMNIRGLIDNNVLNGLCHVLVNEGKIKSWVNPNE